MAAAPLLSLSHLVGAARGRGDVGLASATLALLSRVDRFTDEQLLLHGLELRMSSVIDAAVRPGLGQLEVGLSSEAFVLSLDQAFEAGLAAARRKRRRRRQQPSGYAAASALRAAVVRSRPWTERQANILAGRVTRESERAVHSVVAQVFQQTTSTSEAARIVRLTLGLNERQASAVLNLRQRILARPGGVVYAGKVRIRVPERPTKLFVEARMREYSGRLLRARAKVIARYERTLAARKAQRLLWDEEVRQGLLDPAEEVRVWLTAGDNNVCPVCDALEGTSAPVGGAYDGGLEGPPAHQLCRCDEDLVPASEVD